MKAWHGRLEFQDVEGGVWLLHADGEVYTLRGQLDGARPGADVVVEGERDESFGFDMTGPAILARRLREKV